MIKSLKNNHFSLPNYVVQKNIIPAKFLTTLGLTTVLSLSGVTISPLVSTSSVFNSSQAVAQVSSLRLVLDANNGNGNLYLYPNSDPTNSNHRWKLRRLNNGNYMIISQRNGSALDANNGTGNLYLHPQPDARNSNHQWQLKSVGNYTMIISARNGSALDANGGTGNLYLHPNPDQRNTNHLWKTQMVSSNTYFIGSGISN